MYVNMCVSKKVYVYAKESITMRMSVSESTSVNS